MPSVSDNYQNNVNCLNKLNGKLNQDTKMLKYMTAQFKNNKKSNIIEAVESPRNSGEVRYLPHRL